MTSRRNSIRVAVKASLASPATMCPAPASATNRASGNVCWNCSAPAGLITSLRAPRTNISETDVAYHLSFELPGLEEKDIHVDLQDHTLTVSAERKDDRETGNARWHRVEHRYGQFSRTISLPQDAANSGIEAVYQKGVLLVTVPKAPESRPTKIQVRGA